MEFPLSEENQDKYFDHSEIDTNGTTFEVYKIDGKFYDVLGNEVKGEGKVVESKHAFDPQTSLKEINEIVDYFYNLMEEKGVKPEDLAGDGAVYYRNGNDGTDFDWQVNDNTCEFMMFYKSSEMGFAKLQVTKSGDLVGYYWGEEGYGEGEKIGIENFTQYPEEFVALCYEQADMLGKYDEPINNINWDADVQSTYYDWMQEYEDDEEWYEEDDYYEDEE